MNLLLQREALKPAAIGTLWHEGVKLADSLERPWRDNITGLSCIPPGAYNIRWGYSKHFDREMLHVENVPGRDGILIHAANHVHELLGCIALGKRLGPDSLMESKVAVERLDAMVMLAKDRKEIVSLEVLNPKVAA